MSIHINVQKTDSKETDKEEASVHLMPCTIKSDGDANVSKYFEPNIVKSDTSLVASFRGYPLMGQTVKIPNGYSGYVLYEANEKLNEEVERSVYVSNSFRQFNYWNYDKPPSVNDGICNAINWISIANIIHSPMSLDS